MKKKYEEVRIEFYHLVDDGIMSSNTPIDFEEYDNIGYLD